MLHLLSIIQGDNNKNILFCDIFQGYIRPDYLASFNTTSLKTGWDTAEALYTGSADRIATSCGLLFVLITTFQLTGNLI